MDRKSFRELSRQPPVFLDGAAGTWMQAHGLPAGVCPEVWALEHPELLVQMHTDYFMAGTTIVVTFSFGGNGPKLSHYGIGQERVEELNRELARIAATARNEASIRIRKSAPGRPGLLVSGDIGPTGRFLAPAGDLGMGELVEIYRSQVRGLLAGGVDLFSLETMMDLGQTRAAVRAVRMECDLPVIATLTFDASGRTLAGNSPSECAIALEAAGVDAIGANCSTGPEDMGRLLEGLAGQTSLPVVIKPNAGMPRLVDGKTVFDMGPGAFVAALLPFVQAGVGQFVGGCCGTTPEHIADLVQAVGDTRPAMKEHAGSLQRSSMICSSRHSVPAPSAAVIPFVTASSPEDLQDDVMEAAEDEPAVLGICFRTLTDPDIDAFVEAMGWVQTVCPIPLVFRSEDAALLEALTAVYPGRAGIVTSLAGDFNGALRLT